VHDWGPESDVIEIVAAEGPLQPDPPTTSIFNIYVRFEWVEPYTNSSPIVGYKVFIADNNGDFHLEETYCNGQVDPVLSQLYCEVPMSVLRNDYNLAFDTLVQAKVQAENEYGEGPESDANTSGAKIQTEPQAVQSLV